MHPAHSGLTAARPPSHGFFLHRLSVNLHASQPASPLVDWAEAVFSGSPATVTEFRVQGLHRQPLLQAAGSFSLRKAFVVLLLSSVQAGQYQTAGL